MSGSAYNGWANYETWAVGLYLDGNYDGEGTYLEVLDIARESGSRHELADALKDFVSNALPELDGLASDLLRASLGSVDWMELAEAKRDEIKGL